MLKLFAIGLLFSTSTLAHGQSIWQNLSLPRCPYLQHVCDDSDNGDVYYLGFHSLNASCGPNSCDLYRRRDGIWDSLTTIPGTVFEMVMWRDTLFVCGGFLPELTPSVYYYADGQLQPYGDVGEGANRLRVIEDTLWVVGTFEVVDGQPTCGVAKRVGNQWVPVGTMPPGDYYLLDVIKYQGELIVVGTGYWVNGRHGVYRLVNNQWLLLGEALSGLNSRANHLCEYQGLLYLAGQISMAEGNVGHGVITWNGSEYQSVGGSLSWSPGNYSTLTGMTILEARNGLLYLGGGFYYAGDQPTQGFVTWDGERWCDVQGDFMGPSGGYYISDMAFSGDSLYVASTGELDGMEEVFSAAAAVVDLPGACQDVGVLGGPSRAPVVSIAPNPVSNALTLTARGQTTVSIVDALGREVWSGSVNASTTVDVASWAGGLYTVRTVGGAMKLMVMH